MSVIAIKLEMAGLSLKANRIEEAEKTIMDVLLDAQTDTDSQHSAWLALGSIKMIRFLKQTAIFSEVEYCYKKAYAIKSDELTIDAYLYTLSFFFKTATEAIEISKTRIKELQIKAGIDLLISIGSAYVLNQRGNSLLTNVVGLIGLDYGVSGVIGDINSIDDFNKLINNLNAAIADVIENYNQSLPISEGQLKFFEEEINKNKLRKFLSNEFKDVSEQLLEVLEEIKNSDFNCKIKKFETYEKLSKSEFAYGDGKLFGDKIEPGDAVYYFWKYTDNVFIYKTFVTEKNIYIIKIEGVFKPELKTFLHLKHTDFNCKNLTTISDAASCTLIVYNTPDIVSHKLIGFERAFKNSTKEGQVGFVNKILNIYSKIEGDEIQKIDDDTYFTNLISTIHNFEKSVVSKDEFIEKYWRPEFDNLVDKNKSFFVFKDVADWAKNTINIILNPDGFVYVKYPAKGEFQILDNFKVDKTELNKENLSFSDFYNEIKYTNETGVKHLILKYSPSFKNSTINQQKEFANKLVNFYLNI